MKVTIQYLNGGMGEKETYTAVKELALVGQDERKILDRVDGATRQIILNPTAVRLIVIDPEV